MRALLVLLIFFLSFVSSVTHSTAEGSLGYSPDQITSTNKQTVLAQCLTKKGWAMYSSITCSACRAQKKAFGEAFSLINHIECNPHAEGTQVELCIEKKIRKTPTWIKEENGQEIQRIEGYYLLDDLSSLSGCDSDIGRSRSCKL